MNIREEPEADRSEEESNAVGNSDPSPFGSLGAQSSTATEEPCFDKSPFSCQRYPQQSLLSAAADSQDSGGPVRNGENERLRLLLVDDVRLTRECLEHNLDEGCPDLDILAVASTNSLPDLGVDYLPDIVVLNAHAKPFSDPELDQEIQRLRAHTVPLIAIFERCNHGLADEAARRGFSGIFPGDGSIDLLVASVRLVLAGGRFSPTVRGDVSTIDGFVGANASLKTAEDLGGNGKIAGQSPFENAVALMDSGAFTNREREILNHLRRGSPNKHMAAELGISESTVKAHLRNIMQKLGAANRTEILSILIDGKKKTAQNGG